MNTINDFTEGPILKKLLVYMGPILLALLLQAMYGAVDILVVGQFATKEAISGVSTGTEVINLFMFTCSGFSAGITVLLGKYIGEKKNEKLARVLGGGIALFGVIIILLSIGLFFFAKEVAILLRAPSEALNETVAYIRICGGGILFIIAYNLISAIFRGVGDSKHPFIFVAIATVVNIVLDLLFVGVFKFGVEGAAYATVIAQAISVLFSIFIVKKNSLVKNFSIKDIRFNEETTNILKVGWPLGFQELAVQLSFILILAFVNNLGLDESSGYGVANKIVVFVMLIPSALMQSMSNFIAQNYGAKKEDRCKKSMYEGMIIGGSIGLVTSLVCFFFGEQLATIFTSDPLVIKQAGLFLKGFAPEGFLTAILFSYIGYFVGHEESVIALISSISQTLLIRIPLTYVFANLPNTNLTIIGLASPSASVFGIMLYILIYVIYQKKVKKSIIIDN